MTWTTLSQPDGTSRLGDELLAALADARWTRLDIAVAFVKLSGVRHIAGPLHEFASRNTGGTRLRVGIDREGSSLEAVQLLWQIVDDHGGKVYIARNPQGPPATTFHPKAWLFRDDRGDGRAIVGSGNLTQGGLYTNYELGIGVDATRANLEELVDVLDRWSDPGEPEVELVTPDVLLRLYQSGDLPSETALRRADRAARAARSALTGLGSAPGTIASIFMGRAVPSAPTAPPMPTVQPPPVVPKPVQRVPARSVSGSTPGTPDESGPVPGPVHSKLYMTVSPRQKTEIFLTKGSRRDDPGFFGWPFTGVTTPKRAGNPPQPQADPQPLVELSVFGDTGRLHHKVDHPLKMWVYAVGPSANDDFRITLPADFKRSVPDESVMTMERDPEDSSLDYRIEFFPPTHPDYAELLAKCDIPVPNSPRRYGWE